MKFYRAYDLNFASEICFTNFNIKSFAHDIDVEIILGTLSLNNLNLIKDCLFSNSKNLFLWDLPAIGRFSIENGNRIIVDNYRNVDILTLQLIILEMCIPVLLMQRGLLVLSGSAVCFEDDVILFLGQNGIGKSSLCMNLIEKGYKLISDGFLVFNNQGELLSGFPYFTLWSEVLTLWSFDETLCTRLRSHLDKYIIPINHAFHHTKKIISRIYVLEYKYNNGSLSQNFINSSCDKIIEIQKYRYGYALLNSFMQDNLKNSKLLYKIFELTPFITLEYSDLISINQNILKIIQYRGYETKKLNYINSLFLNFRYYCFKFNLHFKMFLRELDKIWQENDLHSKDCKGIVWVASYPKSGNTWVRLFLTNLMNNSKELENLTDHLSYSVSSASRTWLDSQLCINTSYLSDDEIYDIRSKFHEFYGKKQNKLTYIKIHDAYTNINSSTLIPDTGCFGVIYVIRNPLDVAVSFAHHMNVSIDDAIDCMSQNSVSTSNKMTRHNQIQRQIILTWSLHVQSWLNSSLNKCVVRYEDLKKYPEQTFKDIVDFLKLDVSSALIKKTVSNISFDKLKKLETDHGFMECPPTTNTFFRKGEIGDWRSKLTGDQVNRIISSHKEIMKKFGYICKNNMPI